MVEGQGMVGEVTFCDSDRDVTRVGTRHDENSDAKAWQGKDEDRGAGNWEWQRKLHCIVECIRGGLFIVTSGTLAIALHHYIPILHLANATVSLGLNYLQDS
jgi:hypothetical protein